MAQSIQKRIANNLLWFSASLALAVLVWFVATLEANPVGEAGYRADVQILKDDGMIITNNPRSSVQVFIQAQANVLNLLGPEDILVTADVRGRAPGTYTIPLQVAIARPARGDTQPAQITITLEQLVTRQKPVQVAIIPPSANFVTQDLQQTVVQVEVSGSLERVSAVETLLAELDLSEQRAEATVERTIQLLPVDAAGNPVSDVTMNPRNVDISVAVIQRDDVREVNVRPFILFNTLSANYEFDNLNDWEPRSVLISGSPQDLEQLGSAVDTIPISLEDRTGDFVAEVPLDLPAGDFIVLSGNGTITVDIAIREEATTISLENVPVNLIGVPTGYTAQAAPEVISIVLNGPHSLLSDLNTNDIQAVVDTNGLAAGTSDVVPQISIRQGQVNVAAINITLLPSRVSVTLIAPTVDVTDEP
jgi:YbbR domain-containing protein